MSIYESVKRTLRAAALEAGVSPEEVLGVLVAVAPQVGIPRVVATASELMLALGMPRAEA